MHSRLKSRRTRSRRQPERSTPSSRAGRSARTRTAARLALESLEPRMLLTAAHSLDAMAGSISAQTASISAPLAAQLTGAVRNLAGFQASTLGANDDSSSGAVALGFGVNFFGQTFQSVFVNNNGNLTLGSALEDWTPSELNALQVPIIAPFWADVDTRGATSGVVTYGVDTVAGHAAFGVTWHDVGYYSSHDDLRNTFEVVLIDRSDISAGAFDIEFNYDSITWETGDSGSGTGGLGGNSARAGFASGSSQGGSFYELIGSGKNGAYLDSNPATGLSRTSLRSSEVGRYVFEVRSGTALNKLGLTGQAVDLGGSVLYLGQGIHPFDLPLENLPTNEDSIDTSDAEFVIPGGTLGTNLTGAGVTVGVVEARDRVEDTFNAAGANPANGRSGFVRASHNDFGGRVTTPGAMPTLFGDHATHVAGTIGGNGPADRRGFAPGVQIQGFEESGAFGITPAQAANLDLTNHSYGFSAGWGETIAESAILATSLQNSPAGDLNTDGDTLDQVDIYFADRTNGTEDPRFGVYSTVDAARDALLANSPRLLSVWSAGNERNDRFGNALGNSQYVTFFSGGLNGGGPGWYVVPSAGNPATTAPDSDGNDGSGYDSIVFGQATKNTVVVGAIEDVTLESADAGYATNLARELTTSFSSYGPLDDGRLGVTVVANGDELLSSGAQSDTDDATKSGTSMAAPSVTGVAALLLEHYRNEASVPGSNLPNATPTSATQKGILIHTAEDVFRPGPDYATGYGLVQADGAVQFISNASNAAGASQDRIIEGTFTQGQAPQTITITVTQGTTIKATTVWTDPAGNGQQVTGFNFPAALPNVPLDSATPALVNNLDMLITSPNGTVFRPWVLDRLNPTASATRGNNNVDNVEQVAFTAPVSGTYTLTVGGNLNSGNTQNFSLLLSSMADTTAPQVTGVSATAHPTYNLFVPGPASGPTPLINSLTVHIHDGPVRLLGSTTPALNTAVASAVGHYRLVGDHNGVIPISAVTITNDPLVANQLATATIKLDFASFLPDDRYTLTVEDDLVDPVGNHLDGESNASQPGAPSFPSGDGVPGGDFVARFTVDSRPEIGAWSAGTIGIDLNGNFVFDPQNPDFTNRDLVHSFGFQDGTALQSFASDYIFAGNFILNSNSAADGFDKLAAYGRGTDLTFRFLVDFDNDGAPDFIPPLPANLVSRNVRGLPVAGEFDGNPANGDEVGVFDGVNWHFDSNHNFFIDSGDRDPLPTELRGYPIVGDFDGDGADDLATYNDQLNRFEFFMANGTSPIDDTISFGFPGVRERPVAADMDQDGVDDIGLWVPDRTAMTPLGTAEWFFLLSNDFNPVDGVNDRIVGKANTLKHSFQAMPLGTDIFAQFGNQFALPVVGNFATVAQPINDAPSFTKGPDQTILEDAGPQTVVNWATNISPGPLNESSQTVTFIVTGNTNPALFATLPSVSPNGTLSYMSAPDANGTATITLVLMDNGGTANGGVDTSLPQSFVINVTPVNDAPSFTKGPDQILNNSGAAQSIANWATNISAGPANESAQTVAFIITGNTNPALFAVGPAVSSDGTLSYTPAPGASGAATITLVLKDDGGTANGGVDTSAPQTFTISALDFGDAPLSYPTTLAEDGARHVTVGPLLGAARDHEPTGIHSAAADADDTTGVPDDEDGVTFGPMVVGQLGASVTVVVTGGPARLDAWIDFNGDGSWGGPGEQIFYTRDVIAGTNNLTFDVPNTALAGASFARFRLSTAGNLEVTGQASDGEVEDYQVTIAIPVIPILAVQDATAPVSAAPANPPTVREPISQPVAVVVELPPTAKVSVVDAPSVRTTPAALQSARRALNRAAQSRIVVRQPVVEVVELPVSKPAIAAVDTVATAQAATTLPATVPAVQIVSQAEVAPTVEPAVMVPTPATNVIESTGSVVVAAASAAPVVTTIVTAVAPAAPPARTETIDKVESPVIETASPAARDAVFASGDWQGGRIVATPTTQPAVRAAVVNVVQSSPVKEPVNRATAASVAAQARERIRTVNRIASQSTASAWTELTVDSLGQVKKIRSTPR